MSCSFFRCQIMDEKILIAKEQLKSFMSAQLMASLYIVGEKLYVKSRNQQYAGKKTALGVEFSQQKTVINGIPVICAAPKFDSLITLHLPNTLICASDYKQFSYLDKQLAIKSEDIIKNNITLSSEEKKSIVNGKRPLGYTWHHEVSYGCVSLVKTNIHKRTGHTGGRSLWGGGNQKR